jgi:nucleoid-associated protein YgaU
VGSYAVQDGDTLSQIAARQHLEGGWRALFELNRAKIVDPNLIFPGQDLFI